MVPHWLVGRKPTGLPQVPSPISTTSAKGRSALTTCSLAEQVRLPVRTKIRGRPKAGCGWLKAKVRLLMAARWSL